MKFVALCEDIENQPDTGRTTKTVYLQARSSEEARGILELEGESVIDIWDKDEWDRRSAQ